MLLNIANFLTMRFCVLLLGVSLGVTVVLGLFSILAHEAGCLAGFVFGTAYALSADRGYCSGGTGQAVTKPLLSLCDNDARHPLAWDAIIVLRSYLN